MEPVIVVFVLATGFVSLTMVLPLIFWFTNESKSDARPIPSQQPLYRIKSVPGASGSAPYPSRLAGSSPAMERPAYQVKALPGVAPSRGTPNRPLAVAS